MKTTCKYIYQEMKLDPYITGQLANFIEKLLYYKRKAAEPTYRLGLPADQVRVDHISTF